MTIRSERQSGLGRGLSALIPQRQQPSGSTEIPLPAFSRRVRASANAMPVNGSTTGE